MIKLTSPETYTATIAGVEWSNITPQSDMWAGLQERIANGETVEDLTLPQPVSDQQINTERARRLQMDFEFNGQMFQRDTLSLSRITGAATLAGFAVVSGAQPGNLRWSDPDNDFEWIAADNSVITMDAQTCFAFGQAAARRETEIVFAAKALREMSPIPENFTDDIWWP